MKKFGILFAILLALAFCGVVSCSGKVAVSVDEDVPMGIEYELEQSGLVTKGTKVTCKVWLSEGYGGTFTVSVGGVTLSESEEGSGVYEFTAKSESIVVIDGKTYREAEALEFPHDVLFVDQDFEQANPYLTVRYLNGDSERIYDYTCTGFDGSTAGEKLVAVGFVSDGRNVAMTDVAVTVAVGNAYLDYVRDKIEKNASSFDRLSVSSGTNFTFFQQGDSIYYADSSVRIWIDGGEYHMIRTLQNASGDELCLTHAFSDIGEAVSALADYMADVPFAIGDSVETTIGGMLEGISGATELSMTGNNVSATVDGEVRSYVFSVDIFEWFVGSMTVIDRSELDNERQISVDMYHDTEPQDMSMPDREWTEAQD